MRRWRLLLGALLVLTLAGCAAGEAALPADGSAAVEEETKYIALTFDDGPNAATTARLLDGLRERGASATFFLVGERVAGNEDLIRRMQAEGHQVGNHTWSHVRMEKTSPETDLAELARTEKALQAVLGEGEAPWLRPPYGLIQEAVRKQVKTPLVTWNVDPEDWKKLNTAQVVQSVLAHAAPNAIILLHDIYPTSVDAALQIVDALQKEGYWFVTVEELLALNGVTPQPGVMYRSGAA